MTEYQVKRPLQTAPVHPGELMREVLLEQVKVPVAKAARAMGITRPALYAVLNGTGRVTADMALLFCKLTGAVPDLFLHMQDSHDLWRSQQKLRARLAKIKSVRVDHATA
jgi:addiction module HigA family antidote